MKSVASVLLVCSVLMVGCALVEGAQGRKAVWHGFGFGLTGDNEGVEILDYQYGTDTRLPTEPADWQKREGKVAQSTGMFATFPPGVFLRVRWRESANGAVHEKTVDLRALPSRDFEDRKLYFSVQDGELYVAITSNALHAPGRPDCPMRINSRYQCQMIAPLTFRNY